MLGIAIESGAFKGVFCHGVLSALEAHGIKANAYACASSSVFSGGLAAIGKARDAGTSYWRSFGQDAQIMGMSEVVLKSIEHNGKIIKDEIFNPQMPRYIVAVSQVITQDGAEVTQGSQAQNMGKKLIMDSMQKDSSWADKHLKKVLFDTNANTSETRLTLDDFNDVLYASTRMLHAWDKPAWINKLPFIDASYTCSCPAIELMQMGYGKIIVISPHPGTTYNDLFQHTAIDAESLKPAQSYFVCPDYNLKKIGVDYIVATDEGIEKAYQHGYDKGEELAKELA